MSDRTAEEDALPDAAAAVALLDAKGYPSPFAIYQEDRVMCPHCGRSESMHEVDVRQVIPGADGMEHRGVVCRGCHSPGRLSVKGATA